MTRGKLYGIGVGPGDPKLLTLKAIDTIRHCDVIAVPEPEGARRTAFPIVEQYLDGKPVISCGFSMLRDERNRLERRRQVGTRLCEILQSGKSVGFVTLGDPMVYSTYAYVREYVVSQGFEAETIPGVTSFSAAAAALNRPLCEGNESFHVLPAGGGEEIEQRLERWLDLPGTKVVMKSGGNFKRILEYLRRRGYSRQTSVVSRCTMEGQRVFETLDDFDADESKSETGYFAIILIKERE